MQVKQLLRKATQLYIALQPHSHDGMQQSEFQVGIAYADAKDGMKACNPEQSHACHALWSLRAVRMVNVPPMDCPPMNTGSGVPGGCIGSRTSCTPAKSASVALVCKGFPVEFAMYGGYDNRL